jgi:putative transcriptional regulator
MTSRAGSFLVAGRSLLDPNFRRTVVLLLEHNAEGAFGLVVNRPAQVEELPFTVYIGGPCPSEGLFMLHGHADWVAVSNNPAKRKVAPQIFLGDAACMSRITDDGVDDDARYRILTGYAGWGPGQLESELQGGDWLVVPATGQILFGTPVEELWSLLAPPALPRPSAN